MTLSLRPGRPLPLSLLLPLPLPLPLPLLLLLVPFLMPLLVLAAVAAAGSAHAARPFVTDDARIVDPGGCQIETFTRQQWRERDRQFWFLPGCSPAALKRAEITFGGLTTNNAVDGSSGTLIGQVKTLLKPLETDGWGLAATLGSMRQADAAGGRSWNPFVNLVSSLSFAGDRMVVHANLGALHDRPVSRTLYTWGLGTEVLLVGKLSGIAETYNQQGEKPSTQVGLRYWISPNRLQVDTTLGTQSADERRRWMSVGMRFLF
jgi:hypothetical protein